MFDFSFKGDFNMNAVWVPYKVNDCLKLECFYSAFLRDCKHEYFFQGESHDFWEICYVVEGNVCVLADEKIIRLSQNQMIFHKPMEFHSIRTDNTVPTSFLIISFSAKGELMDFFKNKTFSLNHTQKLEVFKIINLLKSIHPAVKDEVHYTFYIEHLLKTKNGLNFLKVYLENMLYSLTESELHTAQVIKNDETDIYTEALRIINDCLNERLTVSQLAGKCNVSVSYLKKIFAKYNGLGIHEYILQNKISVAKQRLSDGETVTIVADALGFSSQSYFSTVFKRETGCSPSKCKEVFPL